MHKAAKKVQITALSRLQQEAMECFALPDIVNSITTQILQNSSKSYFFSLDSFGLPLRLGHFLKGEGMTKKAKCVISSKMFWGMGRSISAQNWDKASGVFLASQIINAL